MPKKLSKSAWMKEWIKRIDGASIYTTDGKVVFCQACQQQAPSNRFFHLKQHNETKTHLANVQRYDRQSRNKQPFFANKTTAPTDEFTGDLCNALIGANIPFNKLENKTFREFFEKYCNRVIPSESTVRKNYLKLSYQETMERIKNKLSGSYVWASVDETTDIVGRYVANLVVGRLDPNEFCPPFLVSVKILQQTNHSTVARFVNNGLKELGIDENKLLLLTTDAARYMLKAGDVLRAFYPNMIHVTCVCHAIHRVCEEIRSKFSEIDQLISNCKKVFLKAPSRVATYKSLCLGLPLPPQPILTRWGTWLEAAIFYSKNFNQVKNVIDRLCSEDAAFIRICQNLFNDHKIPNNLAYIQSNFGTIPAKITKLESQGMTLEEAFDILAELKQLLSLASDPIGLAVRQKLDKVLQNNPGIGKLIDVAKVLTGGEANVEMEPEMIASLRFAPVNSCDVERSFSIYKNLLSDNRTNFTPENIEMYLICNCEGKK